MQYHRSGPKVLEHFSVKGAHFQLLHLNTTGVCGWTVGWMRYRNIVLATKKFLAASHYTISVFASLISYSSYDIPRRENAHENTLPQLYISHNCPRAKDYIYYEWFCAARFHINATLAGKDGVYLKFVSRLTHAVIAMCMNSNSRYRISRVECGG